MFIAVFVGPLRDISDHIQKAERARAVRVCVDVREGGARVAAIRGGNFGGVPIAAPGVWARVSGLRRVLPFPLMRQALAGPCGVGARVFERNPGDGFGVPAGGKISGGPIAEEIVIVGGMVVRGLEELLELCVGDWRAVDVIGV